MTNEERMIRVTKNKIRMDSGMMGWIMVPKSKELGTFDEEWEQLEPAPPKDWKDDMRTLYKLCCGAEEVWTYEGTTLHDIQKKYGFKE